MVLFAMGMIAVEVISKDSCEPRNADVTRIRSMPNVAGELQNEAVSGYALWTDIEVPQVTEVGAQRVRRTARAIAQEQDRRLGVVGHPRRIRDRDGLTKRPARVRRRGVPWRALRRPAGGGAAAVPI